MPTLRALQGRRVQSDLNHYFGGNHFCGAIDLFAFMIAQKAPFCKARAEVPANIGLKTVQKMTIPCAAAAENHGKRNFPAKKARKTLKRTGVCYII